MHSTEYRGLGDADLEVLIDVSEDTVRLIHYSGCGGASRRHCAVSATVPAPSCIRIRGVRGFHLAIRVNLETEPSSAGILARLSWTESDPISQTVMRDYAPRVGPR